MYKTIAETQKTHNKYVIKKTKIVEISDLEQVEVDDYIIAGLKRFVQDNLKLHNRKYSFDSIVKIVYIKNVVSNSIIEILKVNNLEDFTYQFIPYLNILLLKEGDIVQGQQIEQTIISVQIEYDFIVHQFEYLCQLNPNQLSMSANPTFNNDQIYITTIGLYDSNDVLMATAKLSQPIRKSKITPTNILIAFDYLE